MATALDPDADGPEDPADATGWESVAEWLAGFRPEQVDALVSARELETVFPLLHALTRSGDRDFFVRVAALEALIADPRGMLPPSAVDEVLYWLQEPIRKRVVHTLRGSGWLTFDSELGYSITSAGHFVATVLAFLRTKVAEGSLLPTVEGVDYMLRTGSNPLQQLRLLRTRLEELRVEMERARRSHSEVILRAAIGRLKDSLSVSAKIRKVLDSIPLDQSENRGLAHEIHELLSRLHGAGSELHAAVTEVGRQYLNLVAGLTTADIVESMMGMSRDDLAAVCRSALRAVVTPPPIVVTELLAAEAEAYLSRQRETPPAIEWKEPPLAEERPAEAALPVEIRQLMEDLLRLVREQRPERLAFFVPKNTAPESFLRCTLLPLVGTSSPGEGVAGQLGALALKLAIEGDGYPTEAPAPLTQLTPGALNPVSKEPADG